MPCVAPDRAQSDELNRRAELCAGEVAPQGDVAAINSDRAGCEQVGFQDDVLVFCGLADADAAVLGTKVPHGAQGEILGGRGTAGAEAHHIGAVGLNGAAHARVGIQDGVALNGEPAGVGG